MSGWPNPDKPGYPANPERDGWHWINGMPRRWDVWDDGPTWTLNGLFYCPGECAHRTYLGPCLTPAEADAPKAENARLREALGRAYEAHAENARLRGALKRLLDYSERNTCQHDETHRGGFLWEICDGCGAKWADDMGGKTEWKDPPEWVAARAALAGEVKP